MCTYELCYSMMQESWNSSNFSNTLISIPHHFPCTTNKVISICPLAKFQPHDALWNFATFTPIPNGSKTAESEVLKMITTTLAATSFHQADNLAGLHDETIGQRNLLVIGNLFFVHLAFVTNVVVHEKQFARVQKKSWTCDTLNESNPHADP